MESNTKRKAVATRQSFIRYELKSMLQRINSGIIETEYSYDIEAEEEWYRVIIKDRQSMKTLVNHQFNITTMSLTEIALAVMNKYGEL